MNPKHRVRTAWAVLTVTVALTATACAGSTTSSSNDDNGTPQEGGSITIGVGQPLTGWNAFDALTVTDFQVIKEVFEPLVVSTADGKGIQGGLADSYSYDSTKTVLTFDLPANATFSDGTPLTSADVAFSEQQWTKGGSGALYASIAKVETPTPTKVIFTLSSPNSALLPVLTWASSAVVRKNFGGKTAQEYWNNPVGSGPFMVENYTPGATEITLKKNPTYHKKGLPHLDQVVYKSVSDANQRVLQFKSGEIDVYDQVSPDLVVQLPKDEVHTSPGASLSAVTFRVTPGTGPTSNVNFRAAVSLAIDRKALLDSVYAGQGSVAEAALTQNVPGAEKCADCNYADTDLDAARAALAKSGYSGQSIDMTVDSSQGADILAAQAIQGMLGKIGIKVNVKPQDTSTLIANATAGDNRMGITTYRATSLTLNDILSLWYSTDVFFSGEDGSKILAGAEAVATAKDTSELNAADQQVEQFVYQSKFWVPVVNQNIIFGINPRVKGLTVNPIILYNLSDIYVTGS